MNLKIRTKIIGLVILAIAGTGVVGALGIMNLGLASVQIKDIAEAFIPTEEKLAEVNYNVLEQELALEKYVIARSNEYTEELRLDEKTQTELVNKIKEEDKLVEKEIAEIEEIINKEVSQLTNEEERKEFQKYSAQLKDIDKEYKNFNQKVTANILNSEGEISAEIAEETITESDKIAKEIEELTVLVQKATDESVKAAEKAEQKAKVQVVGITICMGLLLLVLGGLICYGIISSINKMVQMLKELAQGNLTHKVEVRTKDEIGEMAMLFNKSVEALKGMLLSVKQASQIILSSMQQLSGAIEESNASMSGISTSINEIALGMQENASAVEETTASVQEIAGSAESVASSSQKAVEETTSTQHSAEKGNEAVEQVIDSIMDVSQSSVEVSKTIGELEVSSNQIGSILELISGISNQTNLLALNAAIEAARAGEYGSGFAVVAEEIRKLAEQSNSSVKDISVLIKGIQQKTNQVVSTVTEQEQKIHQSVEKAEAIGHNVRDILQSVSSVVNRINDIASSSEEQAAATEQMSRSMDSVSKVSDKVARNAAEIGSSVEEQVSTLEEIGATTEEIASMLKMLDDKVNQFKTE